MRWRSSPSTRGSSSIRRPSVRSSSSSRSKARLRSSRAIYRRSHTRHWRRCAGAWTSARSRTTLSMLASGPVLGVIAGWALGGRISSLGGLRVRWWPLLALAVTLRLIASTTGERASIVYVAANGGMPVDHAALATAGANMPSDRLHMPLTEASALAVLADRIPVALFRAVYSLGDVLIAAGGFLVPFVTMRRR